jgi:hypothetical protein
MSEGMSSGESIASLWQRLEAWAGDNAPDMLDVFWAIKVTLHVGKPRGFGFLAPIHDIIEWEVTK